MAKKWKIKGLNDETPLLQASKLILKQRLNNVNGTIKKYFSDDSAENLHQVRIALRRLRYNLEVFFSCFDKKKIFPFYAMVEHLQDITGGLRDLDVLLININENIKADEINKYFELKTNIEQRRKDLYDNLKLSLMEFLHSKSLKEFKKIIYD